MSVPVQTDPFFGRQDHVDALRRVAHDVSTGHPAFVIMRGEAGIGKTRLVSEFSRELSANDWLVRIGGCTPLIGPTLAFGPWAAAFGGGGQHWWTPEPRRPETTAPVLDQIGDGLLGTLANEQTRKPVAIVLEDLHWADRSSMALLAFVVRGLAESRRVLIWATAREEYGPDDEHEVELVLSELIRRELTVTLPIGQLTATDVRQVALAVAGAGADPEWIESIVRRSAGNPYFARQLAAAGPTEHLPAALQAVLVGRLLLAGDDVRHVVETVALAGVPVPPRVLEWALGVGPGSVDAVVRTALRARLLAVSPTGRYETTHALLSETTVADMLPGRRERLHGRLADAFAQHGPDGDRVAWLTLVAQHRSAAGDREKAVTACLDAGLANARAGAHPEAYRLLARALDIALTAPDPDREDRIPRLRRLCATEAYWSGQAGDAVDLLRALLEESAHPPEEAADLRLDLARALRAAGRGREAVAVVAQAYEAVQGAAPSLDAGRVFAAHAASVMMTGRYRQVRPIVRAALAMLDRVDRDVTAIRSNLLNSSGVALAMLGKHDEGVAQLRESIDLARRVDSFEDVCRGYNNLAFVLGNAGRLDQSAAESMRALAEARERGVEISAGGLALCNALTSFVFLGRWKEAEGLAQSALRRPFPDEVLASVHHCAGQLALGRGNLEEAHRHLTAADEAGAGVEAPQLYAQLDQLRAELALADHEPHTALHMVTEALEAVAASEDEAHVVAIVTVGLRALNDLRRRPVAVQTLDATEIFTRADSLWARTGQPPATARTPGDDPPDRRSVEIEMSRLEYARLRDEDTAAGWHDCALDWSRLRQPWTAGYAWLRAAEAVLRTDRSDRATAGQSLDRADRALAGLGEPLLLADEIRALRRQYRIGATRQMQPAAPSPVTKAAQLGLTAREYEVLVLLAEGLANRRIASTLFISEKTASVHVSRIMAKLGAGTRGEAAAAARRLGLLPPPAP